MLYIIDDDEPISNVFLLQIGKLSVNLEMDVAVQTLQLHNGAAAN